MTKQELNDRFGIPSFFALYELLVAQGNHVKTWVCLVEPMETCPLECAPAPVTPIIPDTKVVAVSDVKAAFDELYNRLPCADSAAIVAELLEEITTIHAFSQMVTIKSFISKFPTRTT
jgi:hypothetical protein